MAEFSSSLHEGHPAMQHVPERTDAKVMPRALPPVYFLAAISLMLLLHQWLPLGRIVRSPWTYLGAVPSVIGLGVVVYCAMTFRRRETTIKPFEVSSALVTDGLYRYSRNPIYLAMVLVLAGTAWALGSASVWLVLPLFALWIQRQFIVAEEAMLADRFGEEYARYRRQTRRWI